MPEDLAAAQHERDVPQRAAAEALDAKQLLAARVRAAGIVVAHVPIGHQADQLGTVTSAMSRVATWQPSRSTVTRWPMRNTSSIRCEM